MNTNGRYTLAGEFKISYVLTSGAAKSSYWKTPCYLCHRRKTQIHSILTPCRPHKSGCWGWNTSLPRNEVSSHPVLGLSPCVGISFPVLGSLCVSLFYLSMCIIRHPHYYIHPLWEGGGGYGDPSLCNIRGDVCRPVLLHQQPGGSHWL